MNTSQRGRLAEQRATEFLLRQGLRKLVNNYRCRWGEIDLIMLDEPSLVFVEVRYRSHHSFGGPGGSIDQRKRQKLIKTAQHYMQRNKMTGYPARFDVVTMMPKRDGYQIQWIADAFRCD